MKRGGKVRAAGWMAGLLLAAGGAAWAQQATTQPVVERDAGYWQTLQDRLASEDPKARAAATKELEQLPWQSRGKLQELADKCKDEEVKASLQERIDGIADQLATDPPAISVDLHDVRLSDVVAALTKETGIPMRSWPPDDSQRGASYTLTMKEKPFWEVFTALSREHPLMLQRSDRLQVMQSEPGLRKAVRASSGFYLFPGAITRSRSANLQADPGQEVGQETLMMNYTLAADPRVKVIGRTPPALTEVTDDAGNTLLSAPVAAGPRALRQRNMMMQWQQESIFPGDASLKIVPNMGKKITSAKGQATFLVEVSETVVTVEKPEEKLKQPLELGDQTISIDKFEIKEGRIDFNITSKSANANGGNGFGGVNGFGRQQNQLPTQVQVLDKAEHTVWESRLYGGTSGGIGTGDFKGPFHIRFAAVNKSKEVTVEFELKDIALP